MADTAGLPRLTATARLSLLAEILGVYVNVRWRMRGSDIRTIVAQLRGPESREAQIDHLLARHLGSAVRRTLGLLPTDNRCLARSLVLDTLLTRRSLQSVVILGVRVEPDFAAHAWVEHDGIPLLAPGSPRYQRLLEL
jgi:transglutaminase superfamily protein